MKDVRKGQLSFSKDEGDYFNDDSDKIELLGCQRGGISCLEHRNEINQRFRDSESYHRVKEYKRSIEALKCAFDKTTELQDDSCRQCADLFRSTITQSLENIHNDLQQMSSGLFRRKRHESSYNLARNVLNDFKKDQEDNPE